MYEHSKEKENTKATKWEEGGGFCCCLFFAFEQDLA